MSVKKERLNGIIQREVTEILQFRVKKEELKFVTVTAVEVSNDYSVAKVYISIWGKNPETVMEQLERTKGYIRTELSHRLSIYKTPELRFIIDDSLEQGNRIEELLSKIK